MKVTYNGIVFNADWAASKTESEFVDHEKHHDLTDAQLKEAHALCVNAVTPAAEITTKPLKKQKTAEAEAN